MIQQLKQYAITNSSLILGGDSSSTTVNKAKMADKAMNAITQYISS